MIEQASCSHTMANVVDSSSWGSSMVSNAKDELICLDDVFECIATLECRGGDINTDSRMQAASDRNIQAVSAVRSGGHGTWPTTVKPKVLWPDSFSNHKNVVDPFDADLASLDDVFESIATPECRRGEASTDSSMQAASDLNIQAVSAASSGGCGHCWTWPTTVEPEVLWSDPAAVQENVVDPFHADWPHW